jgi:hypothetical protein
MMPPDHEIAFLLDLCGRIMSPTRSTRISHARDRHHR